MNGSLYEALVRPALFSLEPEQAHHLSLKTLARLSRWPAALAPLRRFRPAPKPRTVFGIEFPNPVGLAAGFDKNGVALPAWEALGFGFVEIGTVTAHPQLGNPAPRIFRYPAQEALINRLGFNNDGAEAVAARLRKLRAHGRWPSIPVGINLGKSKITPVSEAAEDYRFSFRRLREFADYVVLNVSSPNTPGLRDLQAVAALAELLGVIAGENRKEPKPILLKIAPDLALEDLPRIVATCEGAGIAGIIATNTTLDHSAIRGAKDESGGLSGAPVRERSTEFVRTLKGLTRLPLIGVGGILDFADAREKFEAGAALVQVYTGYVYRGPGLLREIVDVL